MAKNAQIAAGSQPIKVSCKTRQIIPEKNFPIVKNESHGSNNAIRYLIKIAPGRLL
jgi:hypothetical protein